MEASDRGNYIQVRMEASDSGNYVEVRVMTVHFWSLLALNRGQWLWQLCRSQSHDSSLLVTVATK